MNRRLEGQTLALFRLDRRLQQKAPGVGQSLIMHRLRPSRHRSPLSHP